MREDCASFVVPKLVKASFDIRNAEKRKKVF